MIQPILRTLTGIFGYLFEEAWAKPASIRGHLWAALWWLRTIGAFVIVVLMAGHHLGLIALVMAAAGQLGLHVLGLKPVRLGRKLPYGRRR